MEHFWLVPPDALLLLEKDAALLAEWKALSTAAERVVFVEALKEGEFAIYAHLMPVTFFENVNDFAQTFDKYGKVSKTLRGEAYNLYKQQKWAKLEELFLTNKLNGKWPPVNGGYNIIKNFTIKAGMKFDRYQDWFKLAPDGKPILGGSFASPINNSIPYNYASRALKFEEAQNALYYEIEILKDLSISGEVADVIPWFNKSGLGKQILFNFEKGPNATFSNFKDLIEGGFIQITIKSSPNGQYSNWVGTVFKK